MAQRNVPNALLRAMCVASVMLLAACQPAEVRADLAGRSAFGAVEEPPPESDYNCAYENNGSGDDLFHGWFGPPA